MSPALNCGYAIRMDQMPTLPTARATPHKQRACVARAPVASNPNVCLCHGSCYKLEDELEDERVIDKVTLIR